MEIAVSTSLHRILLSPSLVSHLERKYCATRVTHLTAKGDTVFCSKICNKYMGLKYRRVVTVLSASHFCQVWSH